MHGKKLFQDERKRRGAVLRVMCLSLMMVVGAVASLNVALPEIARSTGASQTQLQWIVAAYALAFAALLLPAGALGDRIGRKPVLAAGLGIFGLSSLAAIFLNGPGELIALRGAMGVGAAMIMPVTLSVITTVFPPEERGKAVGTWVGVAAGGGVLGLLASGVLLEWLPWQSIFVLNVVLAAVALVGTLAIVPATRETRPPRLDLVGTLLSAAALAALVFGVIEGPERGWGELTTVVSLAFGRRRSRGVRALGAAPPRADARPAALRPARLRRRNPLHVHPVLRGLRLPLPGAPVPPARDGLLAAAGGRGARADGSRRHPALAQGARDRRAGRRPCRGCDRPVADGARLHRPLDARGRLVLRALPCRPPAVRRRHGPRRCAGDDRDRGVAAAEQAGRRLGGQRRLPRARRCARDRGPGKPDERRLPRRDGRLDREPSRRRRREGQGSLAAAQQIGEQLGPQGHQLVLHAQAAFLHGFTRGLIGGAALLLLGALFVAVRAPGRAESRSNATGKPIGAAAAESA